MNKQKESISDDLVNSQPIQIEKDAKIKRFAVRNVGSEGKTEGVTVTVFLIPQKRWKCQNTQSHKRLFEEIMDVT